MEWKDKFPRTNVYFEAYNGIFYHGDVLDVLKTLPDESVDCIVTSPPYWHLRDYGMEGQIGLEPTLEEYIEKMLQITAELKRVLKKTGVMFWNHGTSYRDKCDTFQNYRLVIRMIDEQGWILRNVIIWHKPNHIPESVKDRLANAYEPVFMLVKNKKYWFDLDAVRVPHAESSFKRAEYSWQHSSRNEFATPPGTERRWNVKDLRYNFALGKNPGDVWSVSTQPFPEAHFATFPEKLIEPMIKAACPQWVCKKCGFIRSRIVDKNYVPTRPGLNTGNGKSGSDADPNKSLHQRDISKYRMKIEYYTVGWTDCGCNAGWEAGVVLDPFMGSGTTAVVATKLNRNWIGIELNKEYCEMAKRRILNTAPLFLLE